MSNEDVVVSDERRLVLAALASVLAVGMPMLADAAKIDPAETQITLPGQIKWKKWQGLSTDIGETATLFGDKDAAGPYLVLMKWNPGYMSAPHVYRTDRLSMVLSGTWWVNSGADFDPDNTVPVPAGSFVHRVAHTPHYDGVKTGEREPAVIALFGIGPTDIRMIDPSQPPYRRLA